MSLKRVQEQLMPQIHRLRCPRCSHPFTMDGASLRCSQGHCYDLSAKGYVNLAPQHNQSKEKYDAELFTSRSRVLEDGFYEPVLDAVSAMLQARYADSPFSLLDAGCGEGYYSRLLAERFSSASVIGVDLSRDGIIAAARKPGRALWLVADLKQLPLAEHETDCVLDVFTPANYQEFSRVLKPEGELIKVIPDTDYLCEIRRAFQPYLLKEGYSNQQVLDHLQRHCQILEQVEIRKTFPLTPEQSRCFLHMTPMGFSVPKEQLADTLLTQITLHLRVLRCRITG